MLKKGKDGKLFVYCDCCGEMGTKSDGFETEAGNCLIGRPVKWTDEEGNHKEVEYYICGFCDVNKLLREPIKFIPSDHNYFHPKIISSNVKDNN